MSKVLQIRELLSRSKRLPLWLTGFTLLVLAVTLVVSTRQVRQRVRDQIIQRDAAVLDAVMLMQLDQGESAGLTGSMSDPGNQLMAMVLASQLRGVMGTRLFDVDGAFVGPFPPEVRESELSPAEVSALRRFQPISRYLESVNPADLFYPGGANGPMTGSIPVLLVTVPLRTSVDREILGAAQFILEGDTIAVEFARLDRNLMGQAVLVFLLASLILTFLMGWAARRLRRTYRELSERTDDLVRANQELALSARTNALGAVTSHLIHGLRSPLAGLQSFVANRPTGEVGEAASGWDQAMASTERMQTLISQVINVLREEETRCVYELSLDETVSMIRSRILPLAERRQVELVTEVRAEQELSNRVANLAMLIVVNLSENAVEVTPPGRRVTLRVTGTDQFVFFEVIDQGNGFPDELLDDVFRPRRSSKEGGAGVGLAISKQLANHLGAELDLIVNSAEGCNFRLKLPLVLPALGPDERQPWETSVSVVR